MNITSKIIITNTNIITDLSNALVLDKFVNLNNIYISDMIKNDEINLKTGNVKIINKFKVIEATREQLLETTKLSEKELKISTYDLINFVIARDNNGILATGDNRLKNYAEKNNVEVIRTLKIIKLMKKNNIITSKEVINACNLLLSCKTTRIPQSDIKALIKEMEKDLVTN